jgi:LPXTG-motif cell wall-anchored protein
MTLVGVVVVIGAFLFGLGATAGATTPNYPPKVKSAAALPFTGGNSAELAWGGGALLVAGAALVGRGRRRAVRSETTP